MLHSVCTHIVFTLVHSLLTITITLQVCLTVAILTRGGKTLLSRQFVPMTRIRVEGLLGSFPKLLGSSSQHTFIETDEVRYVYQGSEDLYVLMVTNKQSNIMEDLETLRLICKLVCAW